VAYPLKTAERVINELGIVSPEDLEFLEEIAWARGALVRYEVLEGTEARLMAVGKPAIITVSTKVTNKHRQRFSIAHEIGHLEMHRHENLLNLCTKGKMNDWWTGISGTEVQYNTEQEANLFASALLLPEPFFAPFCDVDEPSLDYISTIANKFNASLTSTALRYLSFSGEPLVIVWSEDNHIRWFQETQAFAELREDLRFFIDVRSRLDTSTRASLFFRHGSIPPGSKSVPASAWFTPGEYSKTASIKEHSIATPTYNATLSLLWVDDVIEEDEY